FVQAEARRLSELRLTAREDRVDAELELGRHEELVPELEGLVDQNPLRERLRGQLMVALYRSGRQADALEVYRQGRKELMDELGLDPGDDLRRLERAILRHDPTLSGPARTPRTRRTRARMRSRRAAVAAGSLVLAVVVAGLVVWLADPGSSPGSRLPPGSLAVLDAGTNQLSRIHLGWPAFPVALSSPTAWVGEARDQTLARLDLQTHRIVRTIGLGVSPIALATGESAVWVLSAEGTLTRVDPAYGFIRTTRIPLMPRTDISIGNKAGLVAGDGAV